MYKRKLIGTTWVKLLNFILSNHNLYSTYIIRDIKYELKWSFLKLSNFDSRKGNYTELSILCMGIRELQLCISSQLEFKVCGSCLTKSVVFEMQMGHSLATFLTLREPGSTLAFIYAREWRVTRPARWQTRVSKVKQVTFHSSLKTSPCNRNTLDFHVNPYFHGYNQERDLVRDLFWQWNVKNILRLYAFLYSSISHNCRKIRCLCTTNKITLIYDQRLLTTRFCIFLQILLYLYSKYFQDILHAAIKTRGLDESMYFCICSYLCTIL